MSDRGARARWAIVVTMVLVLLGLGFWGSRPTSAPPPASMGGEATLPDPSAPMPDRWTVEGRVFLETGSPGMTPMPIQAAEAGSCQVRAWAAGELRSEAATCDAAGGFSVAVDARAGESIAVEVEVPGRLRAVLETEIVEGPKGRLPDVALGWAESVAGVVVDAAGQPQAGVVLEAMPQPNLGEPEPWRTTTDARGRFTFETLPPGPVSIRCRPEGFAPVVVDALAPQDDVWVVLDAWQTLQGRVIGAPEILARTRVRIEGSGIWPLRETSVGEDGAFAFPQIPEGVYAVEAVTDDDGGPAFASLPVENVSPEQQVTLALIPAQALRVAVVDPGGAPVPAARVSLASAQLGLLRRTAVTEADGVAVLSAIVPGRYGLRADAVGWLPAEAQELVFDEGAPPPVELRLRSAGSLAGRVEDGWGRPIAGAVVRLGSDALYFVGESAARDAWFRSALTERGMLGVTAGPVPGLPAFGGVQEDFEQVVRTGAQGRFVVAGLHAGTYALTASHPDYANSEETKVELKAGEARSGLTLVLQQGTPVAGRVRDGNGRPIAQALVEAEGGGRSVTDDRGLFVLGRHAPRGWLTVRAEGYAPYRGAFSRDDPDSLEIVLLEADAGVGGRVQSVSGEPLAGAVVRVDPHDRVSASRVARTDARGLWELVGLPPGTVDVEAEHPDFVSTRTTAALQPGQTTTVDLELDAGWTVRVRVQSAALGNLSDAVVAVDGDARAADTGGVAEFVHRRGSTAEVVVTAPEHETVRQIVARPVGRDRAEVIVSLRRGGRVEGWVTDYRGDPIANAVVRVWSSEEELLGEARTGARGAWSFGGLPEGPIRVEAKPPADREDLAAVAEVWSDVLEGRVTWDVDVRFDRQ